jgi:hypothetical protein
MGGPSKTIAKRENVVLQTLRLDMTRTDACQSAGLSLRDRSSGHYQKRRGLHGSLTPAPWLESALQCGRGRSPQVPPPATING